MLEELADIEHQRWADWQRYMHGLCTRNGDGSLTIPSSSVSHWERQINTGYADLSEREKQSDRDQVDRYLPIIDHLLAEHGVDAMLNAVHPTARINYLGGGERHEGNWVAYIQWFPDQYRLYSSDGTGPTRTAAIADACRKAREDRP